MSDVTRGLSDILHVCSMDKKRQPNFSAEEMEVLVAEVERRSKVLFSKFSMGVSNVLKEKSWDEVAKAVSGVTGISRSKQEIKKKFTCLKSQTKAKVVGVKKEVFRTGGGVVNDSVSDMDGRIVGLIGEVCVSGVQGGFESDLFQHG